MKIEQAKNLLKQRLIKLAERFGLRTKSHPSDEEAFFGTVNEFFNGQGPFSDRQVVNLEQIKPQKENENR